MISLFFYITVFCIILVSRLVRIDQSGSIRKYYILNIFTCPMISALHTIVTRGGSMMQTIKYKALLEAVESFVKNVLNVQVTDESNPNYGGFRCPDHLVCEPWSAANTFATMITVFINQNSQYYHSPLLLQRMKMALQFIIGSQNDDGTMNVYFSGEMKTTSYLACVANTLIKSYRLLLRDNAEGELLSKIEFFLRRSIDILKSISASTPTQKLVIASVLLDFDKLFLDRLAVDKADNYLSDRININHDGMYGDRNLTYSMLSNVMLLNIAKKTNKPYMIDYVRRNLNFILYNLRSNGEFTAGCSLDNKPESVSLSGYSVWKEMSILDHNGYYATVGDMVLDSFLNNMKDGYAHSHTDHPDLTPYCRDYSRLYFTSNIGEFLHVEDELNNDNIHRLSLPCHYEKAFLASDIIRVKKGKMNATIMGNNSGIFSLGNGQAMIDYFRIGYRYYGYHDFVPKKLETTANSYILRDWFFHSKPEQGFIDPSQATLTILSEFSYRSDHFVIDVSATGEKGVPFFLEFGIRRNGKLSANGKEYDTFEANLISMDEGGAIIKAGDDSITIRGGATQHRIYRSEDVWTKNMRTVSLMITPISPFSDTIQIFWG